MWSATSSAFRAASSSAWRRMLALFSRSVTLDRKRVERSGDRLDRGGQHDELIACWAPETTCSGVVSDLGNFVVCQISRQLESNWIPGLAPMVGDCLNAWGDHGDDAQWYHRRRCIELR